MLYYYSPEARAFGGNWNMWWWGGGNCSLGGWRCSHYWGSLTGRGKHPGFSLFPALWSAANADSWLPGTPGKYSLQDSVPLWQNKQGKVRLGCEDEQVKIWRKEGEETRRIKDHCPSLGLLSVRKCHFSEMRNIEEVAVWGTKLRSLDLHMWSLKCLLTIWVKLWSGFFPVQLHQKIPLDWGEGKEKGSKRREREGSRRKRGRRGREPKRESCMCS